MIIQFRRVILPSRFKMKVPILLDYKGRECVRWTETNGEKSYRLMKDRFHVGDMCTHLEVER